MSFPDIYDRIRQATGLRTQTELAAYFGVRQSSISDAKRRNALPDTWLITLLDKEGFNPAWVRSGEGPQYLKGSDVQPKIPPTPEQRAALRLEPVLKAALLATVPDLVERLRRELDIPAPGNPLEHTERYDEMGKAAHGNVGRLLSVGCVDGVQRRGCLNNAR